MRLEGCESPECYTAQLHFTRTIDFKELSSTISEGQPTAPITSAHRALAKILYTLLRSTPPRVKSPAEYWKKHLLSENLDTSPETLR